MIGQRKFLQTNIILSCTFILYIIVIGFTIFHHELWGDEIHSWNIAKGSGSFSQLIHNTRYEGHPPVWYIIIWTISKFTHDPLYIQLVHVLIASLAVYILLFYSPLPLFAKLLIPFGYFFLYEYSVISRNYAIGVLLAFCVCIIMYKNFRGKTLIYYGLLLFLSNTHLLGLILAGCLHLYFLLLNYERLKKFKPLLLHVLIGVVIFLPAVYFIFPPSNSEMNFDFWMSRWSTDQIKATGQLSLRSFLPLPAWWTEHPWNTEFLLEAKNKYHLLKFINPLIVLILLIVILIILKRDKKSLILFMTNLVLSFIVTIAVFPLTTSRYSGFLFIGFLVAYWLYCYNIKPDRLNKLLVTIILIIQIVTGIFFVSKDIRLPFSNSYKVKELLNEVPEQDKVVTDFWCLNTLTAFTNTLFYCVDLQKEASYLLWNHEFTVALKKQDRYYEGVTAYLKKHGLKKVYMLSIYSYEKIYQLDKKLPVLFQITLIDKRVGAIEKSSDFYLYEIIEK